MPLTAAVLAGGLGNRLRPELPDTPKTVAHVAGIPFLHHLFVPLIRGGVNRIVLCTGFRSSQVQDEIGSAFQGVPVLYSVEESALGTGGAVGLAWRTHGDGRAWIVANGDSYLELDVNSFLTEHRKSGCAMSIAALKVADGARYGTIRWSSENRRVSAFEEKTGETGAAWINGGVYVLEPACLDSLPCDHPASLETEIFPQWTSRGISVYPAKGPFIDIGTPETYRQAQSFFARMPHANQQE